MLCEIKIRVLIIFLSDASELSPDVLPLLVVKLAAVARGRTGKGPASKWGAVQ